MCISSMSHFKEQYSKARRNEKKIKFKTMQRAISFPHKRQWSRPIKEQLGAIKFYWMLDEHAPKTYRISSSTFYDLSY